jgi:uncharacterized membrane-anchored protein YhcB (DUF1043 family)
MILEKGSTMSKWYITGISSIFPIIFAVVALIFGLNASSEKTEIRDTLKTMKDQFDKANTELQQFQRDLKAQGTVRKLPKLE